MIKWVVHALLCQAQSDLFIEVIRVVTELSKFAEEPAEVEPSDVFTETGKGRISRPDHSLEKQTALRLLNLVAG